MPGTALLRVAGRWHAPDTQELGAPTLVLDDGREEHLLAPLPGPDDVAATAGPGGPAWRAAYSAPEELVARIRRFALDHGDDALIELPAPTDRLARRELDNALAEERRLRTDLEQRVLDERRRRAEAEGRNAAVEAEANARVERIEAAIAEDRRAIAGQREALADAELRAAEETAARQRAEAALAEAAQ